MDRNVQNPPSLIWSSEFQCWAMAMNNLENTTDRSYWMFIDTRYQHDSPKEYRYKFVAWEHGDWVELVTMAEYKDRYITIEEHEGERAAEIWANEQDQVEIVQDDHPVFLLRNHWEAMMTLNLFYPAITHSGLPVKFVGKELGEKMHKAYLMELDEN